MNTGYSTAMAHYGRAREVMLASGMEHLVDQPKI